LKSTSPLTKESAGFDVVTTATLCLRLAGKLAGAQKTSSLEKPFAVTWNVLATSWNSRGSAAA
jgi:hypothetical protein